MHKLVDLINEGIPVYKFGSPELTALHVAAKDPVEYPFLRADGWVFYNDRWQARSTYSVSRQVYGWSHNGFRYIVDHGGFFTLQTIHRGQVVPDSAEVTT